MRVLILWADHNSTNLGVRALAAGAKELVNRVWPGCETEFQSFGFGAAPVRINTRTLLEGRLPFRATISTWMKSYDLVLDMRWGDSFSDIYGLRRLVAMNELVRQASFAGVPVVMGPQTIGPFNTAVGRRFGVQALKRADVVMTRDSSSAEYCRLLGRAPDIESTDVVFAIPKVESEKKVDVAVNVSGLLWQPNPHIDHTKYRSVVVEMCAALQDKGISPVAFSHVLDSADPDNDEPAVSEFLGAFDTSIPRFTPENLDSVREFVASARVVVGSRMHACLNSISVGTPAVPLAYSRKFEPLLRDIGWNMTVELASGANQSDLLVDRVLDLHELGGDRVNTTLAKSGQLIARAAESLRATVS